MEEYTFERLWKELDEGYEIYYTYLNNRYLLTKLKKNCYSRELVTQAKQQPHPRKLIITLKSVKETFPFMEDMEYKI